MALFDLISYCEEPEDQWGIREIWYDLTQSEQEQVWSFLSTNQKNCIRTALQEGEQSEPPPF